MFDRKSAWCFFGKLLRSPIRLYAGYAAFFFLLSLFPMTQLLLLTLRRLPLQQAQLDGFLRSLLPLPIHPLPELLYGDLRQVQGAPAILSAAVTALWSSAKTMVSLQKGLHAVYALPDAGSPLHRWSKALLCSVLLLPLLLVNLAAQVLSGMFSYLLFRWVVPFFFLLTTFTLLYAFLPMHKVRLLRQLPGAALSAAGWLLFSLVFSVLEEQVFQRSKIYGSLTVVILAVLWLYFGLRLLFFGGFFNHWLEQKQKTE